MPTIILTIIIAFVIVLIAIGLLAIGWLVTGKSKIIAGACGRDPTKNRDENCSTDPANISCGLCKKAKRVNDPLQ